MERIQGELVSYSKIQLANTIRTDASARVTKKSRIYLCQETNICRSDSSFTYNPKTPSMLNAAFTPSLLGIVDYENLVALAE